MESYDFCLDSSYLGLGGTVELIQANVHANIVSHLTPLYKKAPCV